MYIRHFLPTENICLYNKTFPLYSTHYLSRTRHIRVKWAAGSLAVHDTRTLPLSSPFRTLASKPRAARLYHVARSHNCKLCIYYKIHTIIYAVRYTINCHFFTCAPRTVPLSPAWRCVIQSLDNDTLDNTEFRHCDEAFEFNFPPVGVMQTVRQEN